MRADSPIDDKAATSEPSTNTAPDPDKDTGEIPWYDEDSPATAARKAAKLIGEKGETREKEAKLGLRISLALGILAVVIATALFLYWKWEWIFRNDWMKLTFVYMICAIIFTVGLFLLNRLRWKWVGRGILGLAFYGFLANTFAMHYLWDLTGFVPYAGVFLALCIAGIAGAYLARSTGLMMMAYVASLIWAQTIGHSGLPSEQFLTLGAMHLVLGLMWLSSILMRRDHVTMFGFALAMLWTTFIKGELGDYMLPSILSAGLLMSSFALINRAHILKDSPLSSQAAAAYMPILFSIAGLAILRELFFAESMIMVILVFTALSVAFVASQLLLGTRLGSLFLLGVMAVVAAVLFVFFRHHVMALVILGTVLGATAAHVLAFRADGKTANGYTLVCAFAFISFLLAVAGGGFSTPYIQPVAYAGVTVLFAVLILLFDAPQGRTVFVVLTALISSVMLLSDCGRHLAPSIIVFAIPISACAVLSFAPGKERPFLPGVALASLYLPYSALMLTFRSGAGGVTMFILFIVVLLVVFIQVLMKRSPIALAGAAVALPVYAVTFLVRADSAIVLVVYALLLAETGLAWYFIRRWDATEGSSRIVSTASWALAPVMVVFGALAVAVSACEWQYVGAAIVAYAFLLSYLMRLLGTKTYMTPLNAAAILIALPVIWLSDQNTFLVLFAILVMGIVPFAYMTRGDRRWGAEVVLILLAFAIALGFGDPGDTGLLQGLNPDALYVLAIYPFIAVAAFAPGALLGKKDWDSPLFGTLALAAACVLRLTLGDVSYLTIAYVLALFAVSYLSLSRLRRRLDNPGHWIALFAGALLMLASRIFFTLSEMYHPSFHFFIFEVLFIAVPLAIVADFLVSGGYRSLGMKNDESYYGWIVNIPLVIALLYAASPSYPRVVGPALVAFIVFVIAYSTGKKWAANVGLVALVITLALGLLSADWNGLIDIRWTTPFRILVFLCFILQFSILLIAWLTKNRHQMTSLSLNASLLGVICTLLGFGLDTWTTPLVGAIALTLFVFGVLNKSFALRGAAIVLLAGAVIKVYAVDLAFLSFAWRILSFLALGVVLILVALVYRWVLMHRGMTEKDKE